MPPTVLDVVSALDGATVGQVVEGRRRFALQVRSAPWSRADEESIRAQRTADAKGRMIPRGDLAEIGREDVLPSG
jgi:cobalt-zinc-cadmium resistance protein CzcA